MNTVLETTMTDSWKPFLPPHRKHKSENLAKYAKVSQYIFQLGEWDQLVKPSKAVTANELNSDDFKTKVTYLKKCLKKYRLDTGFGRGITANQIGIASRFSVVFLGDKNTAKKISDDDLLIIVNPVITKKSDELFLYPEMCMSAVPVVAPVVRPAWIEFEYLDENGTRCFWDTKADSDFGRMINRVFQHEIDHMDGIINIFKVTDPKLLFLESDPMFYRQAAFTEIK